MSVLILMAALAPVVILCYLCKNDKVAVLCIGTLPSVTSQNLIISW